MRSGKQPVLSQDRFEVERLVPRLHLEADSSRCVAVEHEASVAEYADAQIHWRAIQHDDLHWPAEQALEFAFEREGLRIKGRLRRNREQHTDIYVAVPAGGAASDRPEEIDGGSAMGIGLKESGEMTLEIAVHKSQIINRGSSAAGIRLRSRCGGETARN